jgi:hypothetical protein
MMTDEVSEDMCDAQNISGEIFTGFLVRQNKTTTITGKSRVLN